MRNIVLVIGHSSSKKGATNYLGESEYDFNKRIALKVRNLLDNRITILYKDDPFIYEQNLRELTPYLALELHFNYFGGNASGCEALLLNYNEKQEATAFLYLLSKKFNIRNRGVKLIRETSRGYQNLMVMRNHCDKSFILEPCFQNDRQVFEDKEGYALLIAEFLRDYLPNKIEPLKQEESLWKKLFQFLWALLQYLKPSSKVLTQ